jgi:hypothetical protein
VPQVWLRGQEPEEATVKGLAWNGRLYCTKRKDRYYDVLVFKSKRDMHAYWVERKQTIAYRKGGGPGAANFEAQVTWSKRTTLKNSRWRRHPCCGEVLFHTKRIGAGIVSHEMTHAAAFHLAWDRGLDPHPDNKVAHEKLCIVQGNLVAQFYRLYWRNWRNRNRKSRRKR